MTLSFRQVAFGFGRVLALTGCVLDLSGRVLALSGCVLVLSGRSGRCEVHRNTLRKVENLPKFHHEQRGYSALHDFPINRVERGRSELETNWSEELFWSAYVRTHRQFFRTQ